MKEHPYNKIELKKINYIQYNEIEPEGEDIDERSIEKKFGKIYKVCNKNSKAIDNLFLNYINLNYKGHNRITVTTPIMPCVFGIENQYNGCQFKLGFKNIDEDNEIKSFFNFIKTCEYIQMLSIGLTTKNSNDYISQIKQDETQKYDPHLTIKVPFRYNKYELDIHCSRRSDFGLFDIKFKQLLKCNIYIDTIIKYNEKYICKWKCSYIDVM